MRARILFLVAGSLFLATVACGPLGISRPEPGALDTVVAQTVRARLTSEAPTETPSPQVTDTPVPEPTATLEPTHTAVATTALATDTPTPLPTTVPATETPTPVPTTVESPTYTPTCSLPVAPQFSSRLEAHPEILLRLGCPTEPAQETWAAEQRFQLGGMLWQQYADEIHIIHGNGTYQLVPDQWEEVDPEYGCPEQGPSPAGLVMPKRGFGWHWCNTPGVRPGLGWALEEEKGYQAVWQNFEWGHVLNNRQDVLFVFYDDGTWDTIG